MFTGIIEQVGRIKAIEGNCFEIVHSYTEPFEMGESIALNGMCATIVAFTDKTFSVDIIYESRQLTNFGSAKIGDLINLERAAQIGQRNSGHNVTGHIDTIGMIAKIEEVKDFWLVRVAVSTEHRKLLVHKGSVAIDGISLTVSGVSDIKGTEDWFEVSIIPHTWKNTTLKNKFQYGSVNIEFDILGKYALNQV